MLETQQSQRSILFPYHNILANLYQPEIMEGTSLNQATFLLGARPPSVTQSEDTVAVLHDVNSI